MPSRANSAASRDANRRRTELVLRGVAFGALAGAFVFVSGLVGGSASASAAPAVFRTIGTGAGAQSLALLLKQSLVDAPATTDARLRPIHVLAGAVPSDTARALASAARVAGVPISWTDSTKNAALAVEVQPRIDPRGGYTLRVAAPNGVSVALRDSIGLIDSIRTMSGGGDIAVGRVAGAVSAVAGTSSASAVAPAAPVIRRILLLADPGWEAKFTTAALEERGWNVEVRYAIGKNVTVTQGTPAAPDTARYGAVIALDSSARSHVAGIRRFAANGGGVIVAGAAATLREFGEMLPGRAGARQPGVPGALETAEPLLGLGWRPIAADSDAAVLERSARKSGVNATIVARRFGAGRVAAVAYDGLWEWRMAGPDGSVDAHRDWWSTLVSSVAYAPEQARDSAGVPLEWRADAPGRAAPYADARLRLGSPVAMPPVTASPTRKFPWELLLVGTAVLALIAEWTSRRLRGAR